MPVAALKALTRAAESGEALPLPGALSELERLGVRLRRGQLSMVFGLGNAGKSTFVQWIANEMDVPTLYFSADQDAWTAMTKLAAMRTGQKSSAVAEALEGEGAGKAYFESELEESNLYFVFDSHPSLEDIALEIDAWVDTWDEYPQLIVIDNLVNIDASGEHHDDQWIVSELHGLAERTYSHVTILAHGKNSSVKESSNPPPRSGIYNQLDKFPALIMSVAVDNYAPGTFRVAVVKTREAQADPDAKRPVVLGCDFETCQFFAQPRQQWSGWNERWE